ncbi:hypothetical protein N7495_004233 [Penicillium taxi]|uniref:uncharacterized protein n=1 Tax=Penicillium taxi TaxID=168475 RepID=UPI002545AD05|nr:uncharacterized protein N7495_004233 [Penicillium taxi]KAJ5899489.1 hypothetical protein N7495_004233 [Penicillium taxi]
MTFKPSYHNPNLTNLHDCNNRLSQFRQAIPAPRPDRLQKTSIYKHRNLSAPVSDMVKGHKGHSLHPNSRFIVSDISVGELDKWERWRREFYKDADAAIWVTRTRLHGDFYESWEWIGEEMSFRRRRMAHDGFDLAEVPDEGLDRGPWLVLLNQRDTDDAVSSEKVWEGVPVHRMGFREFRVQEASGLKWEGVNEWVQWLVGRLKQSRSR